MASFAPLSSRPLASGPLAAAAAAAGGLVPLGSLEASGAGTAVLEGTGTVPLGSLGASGVAGDIEGTGTVDLGTLGVSGGNLLALTFEGTLIAIEPEGWTEEKIPLFVTARMADGTFRSSISAQRGYHDQWTARTPPRQHATIQTWEGLLRTPGVKLLTGYLVRGSGIEAYVRNVRREETEVLGWARLSFDLLAA